MEYLKGNIHDLISYFTLLADITIVVLAIIVLLSYKFKSIRKKFVHNLAVRIIDRDWLMLTMIVSLGAILGSLFYSEIMKYPACVLCWYARVLFYPQFILTAVALIYKDHSVRKYIIVMSVMGMALTAFHYYGQMFNQSALPCGLTLASSECALKPFTSFGFITIPLMGFTGFTVQFIIASLKLVVKKFENHV